jgi:4a-hydroxytetrahydrobiopterin dehydratase
MMAPAAEMGARAEVANMPESAPGQGGLEAHVVLERLATIPDWTLDDGKLRRSYAFANFVAAVRFVDRLTRVAEAQQHHPDVCIQWGRVTLHLWSHDVGGITARDFRLASAIEALVASED